MNWKRFHPYIWETTLAAVIIFATLISRYGSKGFINNGAEVFALAFGLEGSSELKRRGHWKIRRTFFLFIIILFISDLILLLTHTVPVGYIQIGFYTCFAALAAMFPAAYYPSRNPKKSTPQPNIPNAS
jgi:hypothetical protein